MEPLGQEAFLVEVWALGACSLTPSPVHSVFCVTENVMSHLPLLSSYHAIPAIMDSNPQVHKPK